MYIKIIFRITIMALTLYTIDIVEKNGKGWECMHTEDVKTCYIILVLTVWKLFQS